MKYTYLLVPVLLLASPVTFAISKCQDADGKWHYGDVAVAECENSKVTTLNEQGFVTDEIPAPRSREEIEAEEVILAREAAEAEKLRLEKEERYRILNIYETEEDIDRQRDNQLNSIQSNIDVHETYIRNMGTRIERYERQKAELTNVVRQERVQVQIDEAQGRLDNSKKELAALQKQKVDIVDRFANEKKLYIELTQEVEGEAPK